VDWEQVGPASIGADISTLVFGTMRRCEFDAERATELDEAVFTGYVAGLREAGWQGRAAEVRLGFTGAVGLRWGVLASLLRGLVEGAVSVRTSQGSQVSPEAVERQWVHLKRNAKYTAAVAAGFKLIYEHSDRRVLREPL
jgi:hypothetical protein